MNAAGLERHALVQLDPSAWSAEFTARPDLAAVAPLAEWARRGWPLVARRRCARDRPGRIALGLPLPPAFGKRRIALDLPPMAVVSIAPPMPLHRVGDAAPTEWQPTIAALLGLAARCGVEARVYGSFAWGALTGLDYVAAGSDLDLLWPMTPRLDELLAGIAAIEHHAPGRLDGEIVDAGGAAANWRELAAGADEVLVKTLDGVSLVAAQAFRRARLTAA